VVAAGNQLYHPYEVLYSGSVIFVRTHVYERLCHLQVHLRRLCHFGFIIGGGPTQTPEPSFTSPEPTVTENPEPSATESPEPSFNNPEPTLSSSCTGTSTACGYSCVPAGYTCCWPTESNFCPSSRQCNPNGGACLAGPRSLATSKKCCSVRFGRSWSCSLELMMQSSHNVPRTEIWKRASWPTMQAVVRGWL
jgi:hypothetical protein